MHNKFCVVTQLIPWIEHSTPHWTINPLIQYASMYHISDIRQLKLTWSFFERMKMRKTWNCFVCYQGPFSLSLFINRDTCFTTFLVCCSTLASGISDLACRFSCIDHLGGCRWNYWNWHVVNKASCNNFSPFLTLCSCLGLFWIWSRLHM